MKILAITLTLLSTLSLGCNTNAPGKNLPLESPSRPDDYSRQLVDAITTVDANELTYVFKGYEQAGNKVYIKVHAFGDSTNVEMPILVKQWNKLEGVKETKGVGYQGAELSGLELALTNDEIAKFEYKTLGRIID
ncbi:hypothetical protein IWX76_001772 [Pedobacter sp. CAN_A7]|uniref:hypothetical protein n=1 Tax=Pedobacter sp. CAN_A7 TaxID=2787722 RepID=UPI0018C9B547